MDLGSQQGKLTRMTGSAAAKKLQTAAFPVQNGGFPTVSST
jgi:hypothetical protein